MIQGTFAATLATALLLVAPTSMAANLCDGPCSLTIDFPQGGSISAPDGATLMFGPEGALLELGEGGAIAFGEGGGFHPLENGPPTMVFGGTIVLGPGGSIQFGPSGSLATGEYGAIAAEGAFEVVSARAVSIDSPTAVRVGDLTTHGVIEVVSQDGDILYEEAGSPFTFTMPPDDTESHFTVTAVGDVTWGKLRGAPNISVTAMNADSINIFVEATLLPGEPVDPALSCGGASAGTLYLTSSGTPPVDSSPCFGTIGGTFAPLTYAPITTAPGFGASTSDHAAGSMGLFGLLVGVAALVRRRR
ncbi:MAG: hypothetical protein ACRETF_07010 [Nevskiaceae bacterium]